MPVISPERLSTLIGRIYDCTIDPDQWPNTMQDICSCLECMGSAMLIQDLRGLPPTFLYSWNTDRNWLERYLEYAGEVAALYNAPDVLNVPLDNPIVLSHTFDERTLREIRVYREWAAPQGVCDFIQTTALRTPDRIGLFSAYRSNNVGPFADREIKIMRLLAPHIRRAVTISDLMDLKKLETRAVAATLDNLSAGVVVVAKDSRILHANEAARLMFKTDGPVRSFKGKLSAMDGAAARELTEAIAFAQRDEAMIGATGIGIALKSASGAVAIAHVLPLAYGELRTRLMPQAIAAVFVMQTEDKLLADMSAIARNFGLTPAETHLLEHLAQGATLTDVSRILGISLTTAKTHLSHIFSKTGVTRQADLIALVNRLTPQIKRSTVS
jgi:DNA-binding CsgD family transcriptional regulator/PAS domain-containing protein